MGIVNLTPDSFSDGGKYNKKNLALKHVNNLLSNGAKIIDVGGELQDQVQKILILKKNGIE